MRRHVPGFLFAIALVSGCATPSASILSQTATYAPTTQVEVLLEFPAQPHKTFAILEDTYGGTPAEINARLTDTARRIGADAVVIVAINDKKTTDWVLTDPYYVTPHRLTRPRYQPVRYTYRVVRAKAIKYMLPPVTDK
jgi:hypothetical protein